MITNRYLDYLDSRFLAVNLKYWDYKSRDQPLDVPFSWCYFSYSYTGNYTCWNMKDVVYVPCTFRNKQIRLVEW